MEYDERTALVVVDVQNDFADPKGSLAVAGGEAVVEAANVEIGRAVAAGAHVVYTQDWHPESTPHFEKDGGVWPVHCVHDSWGAEFHPALDFAEGSIVRKGTDGQDGYSAFSVRDPIEQTATDTPLESLLSELGVEKVVIVGLATDYCVRESAMDAVERGFETTVLRRAVAAVDVKPGDGEKALSDLADAGVKIG